MYGYQVYYDGVLIFGDKGWDTPEEANEDAQLFIESQIEYREADNVPCDRLLFNVVVRSSYEAMMVQ